MPMLSAPVAVMPSAWAMVVAAASEAALALLKFPAFAETATSETISSNAIDRLQERHRTLAAPPVGATHEVVAAVQLIVTPRTHLIVCKDAHQTVAGIDRSIEFHNVEDIATAIEPGYRTGRAVPERALDQIGIVAVVVELLNAAGTYLVTVSNQKMVVAKKVVVGK